MTSDRKFITFGAPTIENEEIEEVLDSMRSRWLGTGPKVHQFEYDFKTYKGANFSTSVNSCTAGLHLSLLALDMKPGDEVITTPLTFVATINSIIHAGAKPVLADVEFDTMNINPLEVEKKITSKTKCILPVHFAGRPCNMESIMEISKSNNIKVIEDCAHAIETKYKGQHAGTFGDFGIFSFYATKNISTGEGGMVLSKAKKDSERIKKLALHGMSKDAWRRFTDAGYQHYYVEEPGFKYNMTDLQAAIGIHQLKKIHKFRIRRKLIWDYYNSSFESLPILLPANVEKDTEHAYHLYTILIDEKITGISRDFFLNRLNEKKIGCGVHYLSIPEHPFYNKMFDYDKKQLENSKIIGLQTVSLPLSPSLTDEEVNYIVNTVKKILN